MQAYAVYVVQGSTSAAKKAAKAWFLKNAPGGYGSNNVWRTIEKWGLHFEAHGTVHDNPRSGRPPVVSDEHARELAELMANGYHIKVKRLQVWRGFCSLKDAMEHCPRVQDILAEYPADVDLKSLQRRIYKVAPWLKACKRSVDFKTELDADTKAERAEAAAEMQQQALEELRGVVYTDAKKLHVKPPKKIKVYTLDADRVVEDGRLPQGKFGKGIVLHYYAAVNALIGVVAFAWVTGTTGLRKGYKTQVGMHAVELHVLIDYTSLLSMGCEGLTIEMHA